MTKDNPKKVWQQQPPQSRLLARDGKLYIVAEYAKDEPGTIEALWYPTGARVHYNFDEFPDEGYPARSLRDGNYSVKTGLGFSGEMRVQLERGGQTTPDFVEARQVEPPKVRPGVELSWDSARGLWLKASKSTKWQRVVANPLPGSPWLWVVGAVAAVGGLLWWKTRKAEPEWSCKPGEECTKFWNDKSWHVTNQKALTVRYNDPTNLLQLTVVKDVKGEIPYTVYSAPLMAQFHPVQTFIP